MSAADPDQVARLIEQLLADPRLRERFRRDPVRACRSLGLDAIADEMAAGAGKAGETLDLRESRSSLAGVLMAAAVEGIAVAQLLEQARVAGGALAEAAGRVTLPSLPALPDPGGHGGAAGSGGAALAGTSDLPGGDGAPGPTAGDGSASGAGDMASGDGSVSASGDAVSSDAVAARPPRAGATADAVSTTPTTPTTSTGAAASTAPPGASVTGAASPVSDAAAAAAGATAPPTPEVAALLANSHVDVDDTARATFLAGRVPAPAVRALADLASAHDLAISVSPANASAVEITSVDGAPVGAANIAARDLAEHLATLPTGERPVTIATPWRIDGAPFVHDPSVDDRLRLSYGDANEPASGEPSTLEATPTPTPTPTPTAAPPSAPPAATDPAPSTSTETDDLVFRDPTARRAAAPMASDDDSLVFPTARGDAHAHRLATEPATASPAADAIPAITDYPGDGAPRSEIAAWMATKARERGLPGELPVMASLVESGMKNLSYGDRDSVGFFQMRTEIWNSGDYKGYPDRPDLQLKWFLDHAAEVRAQRVARGQSIDDPHQFGEWIADVERPAEQYRGRYQLRLDEARSLLHRAGGGEGGGEATRAAVEQGPGGAAQHGAGSMTNASDAQPGASTGATADAVAHSADAAASAAAQAVLDNPHIHLDEVGRSDVRTGKMDPRILAVLTRLAKDHDLRISCTKSDHPEFTTGGSVSNHFHGRALDVAYVDGQIVNGASPKSRALAEHLASLPKAYRPDEIGTPWAIAAPGYFTDADHQDHIHIGFKTALPGGWTPPADVAPVGIAPAAEVGPEAAPPGGAPAPASHAGLADPSAASPPGDDDLVFPTPAHRERRGGADGLSFPVQGGGGPAGSAGSAASPEPSAISEPAAAPAAAAPADPSAAPSAAADAVATPAATPADPRAATALKAATAELGAPYLWGGSSPKTGFDCSGLVQWAYARAGIRIPRVAQDQFDAIKGALVDRAHVQAGDLVFFRNAGGEIHHVGMAIGGGRFVHAPHTGDVVKISRLDEPYYAGQFAGARRPAGGAPDATAVRAAEEARIGDARAAADRDSLVFQALSRQEASSHNDTLQFLAVKQPPEAERLQSAAERAGIPVADTAPDAVLPTGGYPGDDAGRVALARWLGAQARKHGLPAELPVMAALTESGLQNLNYGDRDSVGFFQMRTAIWNEGAYAGFPDRPDLQARWFIDQALAVRRARIAAGDATFGRDPSEWGDWVADIERPAEQYRGRYQLRLAEARRLLGGG